MADVAFVLDKQNRFVAGRDCLLIGRIEAGFIAVPSPGKINPEGRAKAKLTFHFDRAAELLDDLLRRIQPEPDSLPAILRRERRVEDFQKRFIVHARTGIAHRQTQERLVVAGVRRPVNVLRRQRDLAAFGHGIMGIDDEVDDHLLELATVTGQ